MPDSQPGDLSVPSTQLDINIGHYETIYKKCSEAAARIEFSTPTNYRRHDRITEILFKRFCDDQVEASKTKQMMNAVESLLGILGARR